LITLTITGDVPSKKNSKQIVYVKQRPLVIPSSNYTKWHKQALSQLLGQKPITTPIERVDLTFYPSTKRRADATNKAESAMDLLVDAGIIEDDNWFVIPEVRTKLGEVDRQNPRVQIEIYS
jgi:Holliday junction resolvase RusA-like endonuclease